MNKPKHHHHFVAQFHQKNFSSADEMIWVYDREGKTFKRQHVEVTAAQNHYYRFRMTAGGYSTELEDHFANIEGHAATAIQNLAQGGKPTSEDIEWLAMFISFQATRVPEFEKRINELKEKTYKRFQKTMYSSVEEAQKAIDEYCKETGEGSGLLAEEVYRLANEEKYRVKIPREDSIRTMLVLAPTFIDILRSMNWQFLFTPKSSSFILTDNPFIIIPPANHQKTFWGQGVGIATPGAIKIIPLAINMCLSIGDAGSDTSGRRIEPELVRQINLQLARHSDRFIYARDERLLRSVVKRSHVDEIPIDRERVIFS